MPRRCNTRLLPWRRTGSPASRAMVHIGPVARRAARTGIL